MKNIHMIISATLCSLMLLPSVSYAQKTPMGKFARAAMKAMPRTSECHSLPNRADDEIPTKTVVDQHFDKWTAGTNAEPDTEMLGGGSVNYVLPADLMGTKGWTGNEVYQAGQACALRMYESEYGGLAGGFISTPEMELSGDVVLKFRARCLKAGDEGVIRVALCDNNEGPVDDRDFDISDQWQEFTFATDQATFNPNNIFQFSAEEVDLLLDDIVVTRKANKIPAPQVLQPVNNSSTSFTARWSPTTTASSYLLNVYRKEMPEHSVEPGSLSENFDGININADGKTINQDNPNYPEGWTINLSAQGSQDVYTSEGNYSSAPLSLCLDAVGDEIISPETPAPITSLSFWVKPSNMENETDYTYSLVQVAVYNEKDGWIPIANMPNYYMQAEGGQYSFTSEQIGEGMTRVKFFFIQKNSVDFAIDDVKIDYATQRVPVTQLDKELTDTCYTMDIDPNYEYFYNVRAKNGSVVSKPSPDMWVDGILGVKVEAKEATNVTETSFTANWTELNNADRYKLNIMKVLQPKEDMQNVVVLSENFNKIDQGTIDNPYNPYTYVFNLAENGYTTTEWLLQLPYLADGMAGAQQTNVWMGLAGLVTSPHLDLTCDGGAFDVDVKAYNTFASDTLFVMLLKDYTDNVATDHRIMPLTLNGTGMTSATIHFDATDNKNLRENVILAFMSMYGQPFFIDEVTIRQNVRKGETLIAPYSVMYPKGSGFNVTDLDPQYTYAYDVTAMRTKDYTNYVSETSERVYVNGIETAVGSVSTGSNALDIRVAHGSISLSTDYDSADVYDMQGKTVATVPAGRHAVSLAPGVYIVKAGEKTVKVVVP